MTDRINSINPLSNRLTTPNSIAITNSSEFQNSTAKLMTSMPNFLNQWQANDLANNEVSGYHTNPVATVSLQIKTVGTTITSNTAVANVANLAVVYTSAVALANNAQFMKDHTDRLSGVVEPTADTIDYPHYRTAIGTAQMVMYLTNQLDNVSNNSPILGCFGSVMLASTLNEKYQTIQNIGTAVVNSITITTIENEGGASVVYGTTLTPSQISAYNSSLSEVSSYLFNTIQTDINYFNSCKTVVSDYNKVDKYSKIGQTESYLLKNFVGSEKLKSRLNSQ